jgi:hypothetical protein
MAIGPDSNAGFKLRHYQVVGHLQAWVAVERPGVSTSGSSS